MNVKGSASRNRAPLQVRILTTAVCIYKFLMNEFTPQGCTQPVALVSDNCDQLVLDVINKCWDKTSSGLGSHIYVEELIESISDQETVQEYWEEYQV